jgi:cobyric acid synthase
VRRVTRSDELVEADAIVLPGSKETTADLRWLRERALDVAIGAHARSARCSGSAAGCRCSGGGSTIRSARKAAAPPTGWVCCRCSPRSLAGKTTVRVSARVLGDAFAGRKLSVTAFDGYEIHLGATRRIDGAPFCVVCDARGDEREDGAVSADGLVSGTYVHGIFDDDAFRHAAVDALRARCGLAPAQRRNPWRAEREARYDRLASVVRAALDVPSLAQARRPVAARAGLTRVHVARSCYWVASSTSNERPGAGYPNTGA